MAKARMSQNEVKRKIAGFSRKLKYETDKEKRHLLQKYISKYRHYDEYLNKKREKKELKRTKILSNWDLEMWDTIGKNIKFTIEPFKKYMSN